MVKGGRYGGKSRGWISDLTFSLPPPTHTHPHTDTPSHPDIGVGGETCYRATGLWWLCWVQCGRGAWPQLSNLRAFIITTVQLQPR